MFSFAKSHAVVVLVLTLSLSELTHAAISEIVAFGDSFSDSGNLFAAVGNPRPPYYDGNFSNGPVWVEGLAEILRVSAPTPSLEGGTNYAWAGARTTKLEAGFIPSAQSQVASYLTDVGGVADPDALYTLFTGGNDILDWVDGKSTLPELLADGAAVASIANDLLLAGAQNILVLNIDDVGAAPGIEGIEAMATEGTILFNDALFAGLVDLDSMNISFLDTFTLSQQIAADPGAYGLTNADGDCLLATGGLGGPLCDTWLFWDGAHPTAAGHELFAVAAAATVVPVPAAVWLFGSALMVLAAMKRKKA